MSDRNFLRADGTELVDGSGTPVVLRGIGLGNWMLPEGYMWRFPQGAPQSPTSIEGLVRDLLGEPAAVAFWRSFRERFITEADIATIASEGFDHVRLPMSHRLLADDGGRPLPEGYELIDRLVGWCRGHGLRIVLDLHAAPGGQTGTNIDDSSGRPDLFVVGEPYRERTVALWHEIASRYSGEDVIAAYDLLNEPLPPGQERHVPALIDLYRDITTTIREVDDKHLLSYEGTRWATDWAIFGRRPDPNAWLQFHKYWSPPDLASIRPYLEARDRLGLPIYMGEGGENAPPWLQAAFGLYDRERISWNLWTWKKVETWSSPYSIRQPRRWPEIVAYASGEGPKPSQEVAAAAFSELLLNMDIRRCDRRDDVLGSVFRRAPVRLVPESFAASGGERNHGCGAGNSFRAEASVRVSAAGPSDTGFDYVDSPWDGLSRFRVELQPGDWVEYDVESGEPTACVAAIQLEAPVSELPRVSADGTQVAVQASGSTVLAKLPYPGSAGRWSLRVAAQSDPIVLVAIRIGLEGLEDEAEISAR